MSEQHSLKLPPIQPPQAWKYLLLATLGFGMLILCASISDAMSPPNTPNNEEAAMKNIGWIGFPLALILAFSLIGHYLMSAQKALTRDNQIKLQTEQARKKQEDAKDVQGRREYVLEIIGLGVTLDKYRQGKLWDRLQTDSPYTSIREQDPKKYEWTDLDKLGVSGSRLFDAFENGAKHTPMYWGVPMLYAGPADVDVKPTDVPSDPIIGSGGDTQSTGMLWHLSVNGPWKLDERPDHLLEEVFALFDQYPDLPYVVIEADDSPALRDSSKTPTVKTGYYVPDMPDSAAVFVLARRERVEPLRNYIWDDPDNNFVEEEFRQMYYKLMASVPTHAEYSPGHPIPRPPLIKEWLPAAAAFAKKPEIHPEGHRKYLINFKPYQNSPPRTWKPTPWFPIPWNREQLATFDALPTLGFLHRPVFVKFTDETGHPIQHSEQRQQVLSSGWQQALQTLPDSERAKGPTRIVAGTNHNTEQLIALELMLHHYAADGGPKIDTGKTAQFINTDHRLGNTGAATFFLQMALGVMGSYREGGVSAAINLRDPNEASIIFITPPSDDKRKSQKEPFGHNVEPAIDPKNYEVPAVETLLNAQRQQSASPPGNHGQQTKH